jgi:RNA polymerase sigma-70 factor, ECF subfamily
VAEIELESIFRRDHALILGAVARYTADLQLSEDAVQEAFARALANPGELGRLRNPASWITTVARRIAIDMLRHDQRRARLEPIVAADLVREREAVMSEDFAAFVGDERLLLILLACHPTLSEEARVALSLRFVCDVPTADIADVFLVTESTMAARLTRAKKQVRAGGLRFGIDSTDTQAGGLGEAFDRLDDALSVIYLLYTLGHTAPAGNAVGSDDTRAAAIALAEDVVRFAPGHREALGLLALLLLSEARQAARLIDHELVALDEADRSLWNHAMITRGLELATDALPGGGRFALQAGIAGLHARASAWSETDFAAIATLYDRLVEVWPSPAARLNRVVARGCWSAVGPHLALRELAALEYAGGLLGVTASDIDATRAELLRRAGRRTQASAAFARAATGERNGAVRRFYERRANELG